MKYKVYFNFFVIEKIILGIFLTFFLIFSSYKLKSIYYLNQILKDKTITEKETIVELKKLKKVFFTKDEVLNFQEEINDWIKKNNVVLKDIKIRPYVNIELISGDIFEIEILSDYEKICDFIKFLKDYYKKIYFEKLNIYSEGENIIGKFTLILYYLEK